MDSDVIKEIRYKLICNALNDIDSLSKKHLKYLTKFELCCCLIDFSILTLREIHCDDCIRKILEDQLNEMKKLKNLEFAKKVNAILKMESDDPSISDR